MRVPKYRAWYNGKMYEVAKLDLWGDPDQTTCELASLDFDEEELFYIYLHEVKLMQFTGLNDKNGKEIYEGDICNCREYECYGVIKWNEDNAGFYFYVVVEGGGFDEECLYEYVDELEVIGNIYESPELLEK